MYYVTIKFYVHYNRYETNGIWIKEISIKYKII